MRVAHLRPLLLRSAQATQLAVEKGILHTANRDRFPRPLPDRGPVTLQLVLTEVHCLQDTVEINRDDMWLAGITHDRCGLTTRSISPILLGRYREGTRERMKKTVASPPSRMVPYLVTLVLCEGEGVSRQLSAYVADLHAVTEENVALDVAAAITGIALSTLVGALPVAVGVGLAGRFAGAISDLLKGDGFPASVLRVGAEAVGTVPAIVVAASVLGPLALLTFFRQRPAVYGAC